MMDFKIADNAPHILFGQLGNDLIDDLAVSLALQFAHNSLHDLTLIFVARTSENFSSRIALTSSAESILGANSLMIS